MQRILFAETLSDCDNVFLDPQALGTEVLVFLWIIASTILGPTIGSDRCGSYQEP